MKKKEEKTRHKSRNEEKKTRYKSRNEEKKKAMAPLSHRSHRIFVVFFCLFWTFKNLSNMQLTLMIHILLLYKYDLFCTF